MAEVPKVDIIMDPGTIVAAPADTPITAPPAMRPPSQHSMTWDGPFGGSYVVRCACGWAKNTLADNPSTSIGSVMDGHIQEVS